MTEQELELCPFCRSCDCFCVVQPTVKNYYPEAFIKCMTCGATGPTVTCSVSASGIALPEHIAECANKAQTAWSIRQPSDKGE